MNVRLASWPLRSDSSEQRSSISVRDGFVTGVDSRSQSCDLGRCPARCVVLVSVPLRAPHGREAPLPDGLEVEVASLTSAPYVDLTLQALAQLECGSVDRDGDLWRVRPSTEAASAARRKLVVESDFSAVAYPAAAACISGGEVEIQGVSAASLQGDLGFLDVLAELGATVEWREEGSVVVGGRPRTALDHRSRIDGRTRFPTLAAVAAFCPGTTRIRGVAHLRIKESDRLNAMVSELGRCGVAIRELEGRARDRRQAGVARGRRITRRSSRGADVRRSPHCHEHGPRGASACRDDDSGSGRRWQVLSGILAGLREPDASSRSVGSWASSRPVRRSGTVVGLPTT